MLDHRGWAYFFCSAACRDAFRATPEAFSSRLSPRDTAGFGDTAASARSADPRNPTFNSEENEQ